ncbi:MAG: PASTA domain-containing protein [Treponema sp.]|nr:PASTA domain-containing protein [Treponema sp.]
MLDKLKQFDIKKLRLDITKAAESLQSSGKALVITVVAAIIFMLLVCLAVFFAAVKGEEQVLVPDIVGKQLTAAMLEMQAKELYPKLQLRYTDSPDDKDKVLFQSPDAGAIVKAGSRMTLTVSRGVIIDHVENYVGEKLDDVKIKLQAMFTGSTRPLIVLADPVYKADKSDAGVILEQDPPEGTPIASPVTVHLVVSRGPAYDYTAVPNLVGLTVNELLSRMGQSKLVYDFTAHTVEGDEKPGSVTGQQSFNREYVNNYSRMSVELALPTKAENGLLYGIFSTLVTDYPYPVEMKLDAIPDTGERYTIVTFMHIGGSVTIPYAVPKNTELIFSIEGRDVKRMVID